MLKKRTETHTGFPTQILWVGNFWKFCDTFLTSTKNQTVYNSVLKNRKRNLTAVIFHFVVAVQEHNRRVQLRTYALPNQFQKRLNSSFSIDQEMIFAKIWKTRRYTVLRLMPPLKGTAPNLHTIQFILTEHALFSFYLLWYLFFLSLYSKAISQRPQVSCIFFDENKSDKYIIKCYIFTS